MTVPVTAYCSAYRRRVDGREHGSVFTPRDRPVRTQRSWWAAPVRHGVSRLRSGQRGVLGILFHYAS